MTIRELIDQLNEIEDKDRIVVMSSDSEGNRFSVLGDIELCAYKTSGANGWIGLELLDDSARKLGYSEDDVIKNGKKALSLWPVN